MAAPDAVSILDTIAAQRRKDVAAAREMVPESALREMLAKSGSEGTTLDLYECIMDATSRGVGNVALAAEFKRASPSKGDIAVGVDAGDQARRYARAGASVVSVLTEPKWFKGSLDDMREVRRAVVTESSRSQARRAAVLRKDFVIDAYQLLEAKVYGADTALLIVAILSDHLLASLVDEARALGMEPLVEVNSVAELSRALAAGAEVIGVNNRNLHTFRVDLGTTERVAGVLADHNAKFEARHNIIRPDEMGQRRNRAPIVMALSGITSRSDVERYEKCGVKGVLVGEALMRAQDPARMVQELLGTRVSDSPSDGSNCGNNSLSSLPSKKSQCSSVRVKICGIRDVASALVAARAGADFIGLIFAPKSKRCVSSAMAREIVSALRAFREQEDDHGPSPVKWNGPEYVEESCHDEKSHSGDFEDGAGAWFRSWAAELDSKCTSNVTRPLVVGVFQNQSESEVCRIVKESGIDLVQLHGDEGWRDAGSRRACGGVPSIRVVHIEVSETSHASKRQKLEAKNDAKDGTFLADKEETPSAARRRLLGLPTESSTEGIPPGPPVAVLLDTKVQGGAYAGGSGVSFDWDLARAVAESELSKTEKNSAKLKGLFPLIVAGGLTPDNVADAVRACRPWGVDVASGVEKENGSREKDHEKIRSFIANAKNA